MALKKKTQTVKELKEKTIQEKKQELIAAEERELIERKQRFAKGYNELVEKEGCIIQQRIGFAYGTDKPIWTQGVINIR